jgi:hypothetical protein
MNPSNYGVLHFADPREFERPLSDQEQIQQALAALGAHVQPPPIADWPRITDCTPHGAGFSLDAQTPALRVSLRFDPSVSPLGDYKIRFLPKRREETGRVVNVTRIGDDELYMHHYMPLRDYPTRFVAVTSDVHGTQRVWLVGILSVRSPSLEDADVTEQPEA